VKWDQIFLGVGSDEAIDMIMRIFCAPGRDAILITPPTYGMYTVCAKVRGWGGACIRSRRGRPCDEPWAKHD
jgi:histidinol-phosphate aminotransferase